MKSITQTSILSQCRQWHAAAEAHESPLMRCLLLHYWGTAVQIYETTEVNLHRPLAKTQLFKEVDEAVPERSRSNLGGI